MSLNTSLERLKRAGGNEAAWVQKLRIAVEDLGGFLNKVLPFGDTVLPRGYVFKGGGPSDGRWRLEKCLQGNERFRIMGGYDGYFGEDSEKPRKYLLLFADDLSSGWLDEVSAFLEQRSTIAQPALTAIQAFRRSK